MGEGKTAGKGGTAGDGRRGRGEVYILLDRTGSMHAIWSESVSSVNAYVRELAGEGDGEGYRVTLAVFDEHLGLQFEVLREAVPVEEWVDFREEEAPPRGSTPLLDSLVRITAMAEESGPDRAVIVVMTDGYENASREADLETARAALARAEAKGWQVVFLGADFNNFAQARGLGVAHEKSMNVARDHQARAMRLTAEKSKAYFQKGETMVFFARDREESGEDKVK